MKKSAIIQALILCILVGCSSNSSNLAVGKWSQGGDLFDLTLYQSNDAIYLSAPCVWKEIDKHTILVTCNFGDQRNRYELRIDKDNPNKAFFKGDVYHRVKTQKN